METMRKISKRYYLRQMVIWVLVNLMFFGIPFGAFAIGGDSLAGGDATVTYVGGTNPNVTVDVITPAAVLDWTNFDTINGQSVEFKRGLDGLDNFAALNRVTSGMPTSFYGNLYGNNGFVIVSNPSGIVFGGSAFVQARSFAAVGFDIAPEAFMAPGFDLLNFDYSGDNGDIYLNYEKIGGCYWDRAEFQIDDTLALIGKNIYNKGKICVKDPDTYSYVVMAAGDEIVISRENSHVNVDVSQAVDNKNWVKNEGEMHTGSGYAEGEVSLVLAAGDIYSTAIDNVESLRATAVYDATFTGDIDVFADAASDAEAEVIITTGGNLDLYEDIEVEADGAGVGNASATVTITTGDSDFVINNDITAEAYTSGDFDATATIDITSTGKVTVEDGSPTKVAAEAYDGINNTASVSIAAEGDIEVFAEGDNGDVTISADAYDGVNNSASVALAAQGDVTIKARKSDAIVTASAYNNGDAASVLNEAAVSITGKNVTIKTYNSSGGSDPAVIGAYASDAEENNAKVEITANGTEDDGDVTILVEGDEDYALIEAEAQDGSDNSAQVLINAARDIDVKSDGDQTGDVRIITSAHDGTNNSALIELNAGGDVMLSAEDKITVKAEAFGGCSEAVLNQAQVNIDAGGSVEIKGQDYGESDNPAQVIAQAHDGQTNEAGIEILAGGDVLIVAEGLMDDAIVKAEAYNGSVNKAEIVIDAVGNVEIIAEKADAQVLAYAHDAEVSNDASVEITAGGDVKVISKGGDLDEVWEHTPASWNVEIQQKVWDTPDTWDVTIYTTNGGLQYQTIYGASSTHPPKPSGWSYSERYPPVKHPGTYHYDSAWIYGASSSHPNPADYGYSGWDRTGKTNYNPAYDTLISSSFTPYVASVEAIAENAGSSNTAGVDITAGKDVVVLSKDGGRAKVIAYTGNVLDSVNTSTINITAEDGYVLVHGIGGMESTEEGFTASHASVEAKAEEAMSPDGTNTAEITIVARDVVEEPIDTDGDTDLDVITSDSDDDSDCMDGDVMVIGVNGGKAEVEAIAKYSNDNTATVDIEADSDVKVIALCENEPSQAEITALAKYGMTNTAGIDIVAGDDVEVIAKHGGKAEVEAMALNSGSIMHYVSDMDDDLDGDTDNSLSMNSIENTATIDITADSVLVKAETGGEATVEALAGNEIYIDVMPVYALQADTDTDLDPDNGLELVVGEMTNTATVDIKTVGEGCGSGDVVVIAETGGEVDVDAEAWNEVRYGEGDLKVSVLPYFDVTVEGPVSNTATVKIDAADDVKVIAKCGGNADIDAEAWNEADELYYGEGVITNNANIAITAGEDVLVLGKYGGEAEVYAGASGGMTNDAGVKVDAGEDVKVLGIHGDGWLGAEAYEGYTNTADVQIDALGDVKVKAAGCEAGIYADVWDGYENTASVALGGVGHKIGGDVDVISEHGDAYIEAEAEDGFLNNADVLICTEGYLTVQAGEMCGGDSEGGKDASIGAYAEDGFENNASVGICAEDGIAVLAFGDHSDASIEAKAKDGYDNEADLIAHTYGNVYVAALNGGDSKIASSAKHGQITDAYTAVCATGDIIVAAAEFGKYEKGQEMTFDGRGGRGGSDAEISAEAESRGCSKEETTANAAVHVVSKEGGVAVVASGSCGGPEAEASIKSEAEGATYNTAYTGVAAGADLSPGSLPDLFSDSDDDSDSDFDMSELLTGNVFVAAIGNAEAEVSSKASSHRGRALENDAMTVICAPGKVLVMGLWGGEAKVSSSAFGGKDNSAQTKVFASEIGLFGDAHLKAKTPDGQVDITPSGWHLCITPAGKVAESDGSAVVVIGDYASREDCPTCPPCPCEKEGGPLTPDAPLSREAGEPLDPYEFEQGGCPALMQWFSSEVGLPEDQIHVLLSNADFMATDIQPCEACARLKQQSDAMASLSTAQIEAWASTVRAGLVGPITPEMMDGIRVALADNPAAAGFDEAAAQYVQVLTEELGFERDDAVALLTGNYAPDYSDLGAYVGARMGM